ncbi:MAG: hypothetical protein ACJ76H_00525 [Bacteriovoracaceae bacterium]
MKAFLPILALFSMSVFAGWESPALQCPEKVLPQGFACPDLTHVRDLFGDFPADMSDEEIAVWKKERAPDLTLCRYRELLRREKERPGSFKPVQLEIAWMTTEGGKDPAKKLASVVSASQKFGVPPHILIGALTQESLLASLGISMDGGNYSCGIAQLNISEWCQGMQSLSPNERANLNWPAINCSAITSSHVAPFYDIAVKRLGGRPEYQINAADFQGITTDDVKLPQNIFLAVSSFVKNCQDDELSIRFKAANLKNLFTNFVPSPLRLRELYSENAERPASCRINNTTSFYPLHTGWLLAVAMYNAGPRVSGILEHYYQVKSNNFPMMTPKDLVEALHWGGKVKEGRNVVVFTNQEGKTMSQSWYKSCVVQRHVARVVQHVTLPGQTILNSLEKVPCSTGEVPLYRRNSSGIKEL